MVTRPDKKLLFVQPGTDHLIFWFTEDKFHPMQFQQEALHSEFIRRGGGGNRYISFIAGGCSIIGPGLRSISSLQDLSSKIQVLPFLIF